MAALSAAILAATAIGGLIGKKSAGSAGTTPPVPVAPPPPPPVDIEGMQTAAAVGRARINASQGQASTILTGPMGTAPALTQRRTLLGA